jgi:hypothetical protein
MKWKGKTEIERELHVAEKIPFRALKIKIK